jgi:hypothetical protein
VLVIGVVPIIAVVFSINPLGTDIVDFFYLVSTTVAAIFGLWLIRVDNM